MEILQIAAFGIVAAILSITIKRHVPQIGLMIGIAAGIVIFFMMAPKLRAVIEMIKQISELAGSANTHILIILKIVGIAYITEFAAQICLDGGEGAIANKIELAGKVLIMVLASPILLTLLNQMFAILP